MEKILVINNDFDTMQLLKDLLEKKSYQVTFTSSNSEAVEIAKKFRPDVVLVDILQRDSIAALKQQPDTNAIPVIMMTGYTWSDKM